jgi:hypothetical protein
VTATTDQIKKGTKKEHWRIILDFSIITILAIIIFRNFILSADWPAGGDTLGWVAREYLFGHDLRWLNIWHPHSFGFVEGINAIDFFLMLINIITQNGAATVKVFMFSTFVTAGFCMYAFANHYTRNKLAALSAALVYILNQWYFTQLTEGHLGILLGYAIAPLLLLLLVHSLNSGKLKDLTLFALLLSVGLTALNPISVVIYMLFLGLFTVFYLLTPQNGFNFWKRTKRLLKMAVVSGVIFACLSAFYIIPFLHNSRAPFYSAEFGYDIEEAFSSSQKNILDAFVLRGVEDWGYKFLVNVTSEVSLQFIPIVPILFTIFLIAYAMVFTKTDRYTLFFLVVGMVSIFLAKGPYSPYGETFIWSWSNIPHFSVFRAASRFVMVTSFSTAFFVSVLVSVATAVFLKTRNIQKTVQENKALKVFDQAKARIEKFVHYGSVLLIVLVLLTGFLSCWFYFQNGLQTYEPPQSFLTPYSWVSNQKGDFKVITVNNSPSEWELAAVTQTDFGSGGMVTSIGWGHDIGSDSPFIHDKPVLGDGGHTPESRQFVNYLRFGVVRNSLSDKVLKVLSTFDYKYVVLPEYLTEEVKTYFLNQKGIQVVYNQSGSVILENSFHKNRAFTTENNVIVVGGVKSFFTTAKIDQLNLSQNVFIFANQIENLNILEDPVLRDSAAIVFDDSDLLDMVLVSSKNIEVVDTTPYGVASRNYSIHWGKTSSWGDFGIHVFGGYTLTTYGNNRVNIPVEVKETGTHEILVRVGFTQTRSALMVHVDGVPIKKIRPVSDNWSGLRWVNLGSMELEKGTHTISITNDGSGWNDVDAVCAVKTSTLETQTTQLLNQIKRYNCRIIQILTALHSFSDELPPEWTLTTVPYQGYALEAESPPTRISSNATILRDNRYMFVVNLAQNSNQGTPQLYINNQTVPLRLLDSDNETEQYEAGPVYLNSGTYTIEIGGSGKIVFDQLTVYSLQEDEQIITLNDFQLHSTDYGWNVAPNATASASSVGVWEPFILLAENANDADPNTRWASNPHEQMPQWLQIEWGTPQELTGVQIRFELAVAQDYVIQTWSGTDWINQTQVTGNSQLNCTHIFKKAVSTNKIRLLVTSATKLYDLVSVWEFEAYTKPTISRTLTVPDEGLYRVDLCLTCGPEYGTLDVEINNAKTQLSCYSAENNVIHYETEPMYLHAGEQSITVSASGKTDFYAITLTRNDEGEIGFLDNLVPENQSPQVTVEQVNSGKFVAHVEGSDGSFMLVFSESYHPMWKAYIGSEEISPIPVYSIVNGFYITKTGSFDVTIYFTGQTYADVGLQVSLITLIVVSPIILVPSRYHELFGNAVKQKLHKEEHVSGSSANNGGGDQSE